MEKVRGKDFNLPIEGFVQDQGDLENELGLTIRQLDSDLDSYDYLKYIADNNFSFTAINNPGYPMLGRYPGDTTPAKILDKKLAITTLDNRTAYQDFERVGGVYYLNTFMQEVTEIFKDVFDRFVKDSGLLRAKVAVESRRNEITRVFCSE